MTQPDFGSPIVIHPDFSQGEGRGGKEGKQKAEDQVKAIVTVRERKEEKEWVLKIHGSLLTKAISGPYVLYIQVV